MRKGQEESFYLSSILDDIPKEEDEEDLWTMIRRTERTLSTI